MFIKDFYVGLVGAWLLSLPPVFGTNLSPPFRRRVLQGSAVETFELGNIRPEGLRLVPSSAKEDLGLNPDNDYAVISELFFGGVLLFDLTQGEVTRKLVPSVGFLERPGVGLDYDQGHIFLAGGGPPFAEFVSASVRVFEASSGELVATCTPTEEQGGPAGFLNEVAIEDDVAYITDSLLNRLWQVSVSEAIKGNCVISSTELLPAEKFVAETPFSFMSNGVTPYGGGFLIGTTATGALYYVETGGETPLTEEVLPPQSILFSDGIEVHTEEDGSTKLYVVQNQLNLISVYDIQEGPDGSPVPVATLLGNLESDKYDTPTTSVIVGDRIYSVNARFVSLPFPAEGEADPTTFTETFDMVSQDRFDVKQAMPSPPMSGNTTESPVASPMVTEAPQPSPPFLPIPPTDEDPPPSSAFMAFASCVSSAHMTVVIMVLSLFLV